MSSKGGANIISAAIGRRRRLAEVGFVVMWSSGFIGAMLGTPEARTPTLMIWRFIVAAGLLLAGAVVLRRRWPGLREIVVQGVVGLLAQGVWVGVEAPLWAYAMPFAGMAGLVAATLVERRESLRESGLEAPMDVVLGIQCVASALLFAVLAPFWGGLEPAGGLRFWGAVAWFVVFSIFGGYGFYWLNLKLSSIARVSSLIYLTPPTTMVWAYLIFREVVGPLAVVGLVICFGGVLMARD